MSFASDLTSDLENVFFNTDEFAETVAWNGTDVPAIVTRTATADVAGHRASVMVRASDVASPDYRDTVTFDGVDWTVHFDEAAGQASIRSVAGDLWEVTLVRGAAPRFWR